MQNQTTQAVAGPLDAPVRPLLERLRDGTYYGVQDLFNEAADEIERLRAAAIEVIEFNRQHANDQYGSADVCETWACVRTLRAALRPNVRAKRADTAPLMPE